MPKAWISFIAIACIAVLAAGFIFFMKQFAGKAKERSDMLMKQFKKTDADLKESGERLDSINRFYFDSLRKTNK